LRPVLHWCCRRFPVPVATTLQIDPYRLNFWHFTDMQQFWQVPQHLSFALRFTPRPFLAIRCFLITDMPFCGGNHAVFGQPPDKTLALFGRQLHAGQ